MLLEFSQSNTLYLKMFLQNAGRFSIKKLEPWLFAFCILLTLSPILISKYYVTLDGPSHLYNANLVKELISGKKDNISDLYSFNPVPVPNWTGHFIMAFFNLFFPAFLSEKLMMLIYFILTPIFFRKSLLFFDPKNVLGIYFIFPLLHNCLFYFGYFNLCLGITALFASFSYFLHSTGRINIKKILILTILLGLAFFSHLMAFLVTFALLLVFSVVFIVIRKNVNGNRISDYSDVKKRIIWILTCAFPWLILSFNYFVRIDSMGPKPETNLSEQLQWIIDFRPLLTFTYSQPLLSYSRILSALFACLILAQIILRVKRRRIIKFNMTSFEYRNADPSSLFLFICMVFLLLFFFLPNPMFLCERLLVLNYFFFVCWLSLLKFPKWINILSLLILIYVQTLITSYYYVQVKQSSEHVQKIEELANHIPEGNFVLVLNYSDNWLYDHLSGYLGVNRRLALLENYEAGLPWFPVNWNPARFDTEKMSYNRYSNKALACSYFVNEPDSQIFSIRQKNGVVVPVDYVFQIGDNKDNQNPCSSQTQARLNNSYKIIHLNDFFSLYLRKIVH